MGDKANHFWNGAVILPVDTDVKTLKETFNRWETKRGRDKTDPMCPIKNRTLDLDILWSSEAGWCIPPKELLALPYIRDPVTSLLGTPLSRASSTLRFRVLGKTIGARRVIIVK